MPFQYTPYRNQHVGTIADLMGRGRDAEAQALITAANAQAQAAQISGQAWGGALQGIGDTIAAIPGQMQAQRDREMAREDRDLEREATQADIGLTASRTASVAAGDQRRITEAAQAAERDIRLSAVLKNPDRTTDDFVRILGPKDGITFAAGLHLLGDDSVELLSPSDRAEHLRAIARSMKILSPALQDEYWPVVRARLLADPRLGLTESDIPEQPNQAFLDGLRNYDADPTASTQRGAGTDYRSYLERVAQGLGIPVSELTPEQELDARQQFTTAGSSQATQLGRDADRNTARVIADAVCRGEQPPTLTGLRKFTGLVREEMAKLGCDLTEATLDWNAVNRHMSTLNSTGQLRMRQAVTFAYKSLDLVEKFADEWDAGPFPPLNNARMRTAMLGTLGPEAARIANNLNSTITDLVAELAVVYRGGLSPTDASMELAAENLKTEWSNEVLLSGIQLMRDTLQIRLNSINTTGVAGRPDNRYSGPAVPIGDVPDGDVEMRSPDRQEYTDPDTGETYWIVWDENRGGWYPE